MAGSRIKRGVRKTRRRIRPGRLIRFLSKPAVKETLEFFMTVGVIYFAITGTMTLAMGTTSFWMAVTSDSMKHSDDSWRDAYTSMGYDTSRFPLQGGFERGDLLIVQGVRSASEISVGDVIIVDMGPGAIPLVHRVMDIWEENGELRFRTKGDANFASLAGESSIRPSRIIGKAVFAIPKIGHIFLFVQGK